MSAYSSDLERFVEQTTPINYWPVYIHLAGHECRREGVALTPNDENSGAFGCGMPKSRGISSAVF
jgi:hypothetical protein